MDLAYRYRVGSGGQQMPASRSKQRGLFLTVAQHVHSIESVSTKQYMLLSLFVPVLS